MEDEEHSLRIIVRLIDWPCTHSIEQFTFLPIVGKLFVGLAVFSSTPVPFLLFGCYLMLLAYGRDRRLYEESGQ